jgi:hypothetical protein
MVNDLAAKRGSVYDLNAKILPESDPAYDLTAIDSRQIISASVS